MHDTFGIVPAPGERERHAWIPQAVESLAYSGYPGRSSFRDRLAVQASCRHLCNRPALAPVLKLLGGTRLHE